MASIYPNISPNKIVETWISDRKTKIASALTSSMSPSLIDLIQRYFFPPTSFLEMIVNKESELGQLLPLILKPAAAPLLDRCLALPVLQKWPLIPSMEDMQDENGKRQPVMLSLWARSETDWIPRIFYMGHTKMCTDYQRCMEERRPFGEMWCLKAYMPFPLFMRPSSSPFYLTIAVEGSKRSRSKDAMVDCKIEVFASTAFIKRHILEIGAETWGERIRASELPSFPKLSVSITPENEELSPTHSGTLSVRSTIDSEIDANTQKNLEKMMEQAMQGCSVAAAPNTSLFDLLALFPPVEKEKESAP
jgi:hypothetical protein